MRLNGTSSSKCDVLSSVPQASVLKSLTDLLIDDLSLYVDNCYIFLFADDYKKLKSFSNTSFDFRSIWSDLSSTSNFVDKIQTQILFSECKL